MSFQKLTTDALRKLRPHLCSQLPYSAQILNIIDFRLKDKFLRDSLQTDFYGISGTTAVAATFTPFISTVPPVSVIYTPPPPLARCSCSPDILQAYKHLIDWTKPHDFKSVPFHLLPHLHKLIQKNGTGSVRSQTDMFMMCLLEPEIQKLDTGRWAEKCRDNFEMGPLSGDHTVMTNSYWKYGYPGSEHFLAEGINIFDCSRGIFRKGLKGKCEGLVSWGMYLPWGTLGALYVLDQVRSHGLARWTLEECCRVAALEHGLAPNCDVDHDNLSSKSLLLDKIGFKIIMDVHLLNYFPH